MKKSKLRAVGVTCGIGSMLIGAKQAGFEIVGNIEWRKYYHAVDEDGKNTFTDNFKGAFLVEELDDVDGGLVSGIDLACGHPECGNFSNLRIDKQGALDDPGDIPLFVEMIKKIKPRFFFMDDLPKSLIAYSMEHYADQLTDYDLFPEWVSNYHYGNVQKNRKRFFMIGALRRENFVFEPGEHDNPLLVSDVIGDLLKKQKKPGQKGYIPNHDIHAGHTIAGRSKGVVGNCNDRMTNAKLAAYVRKEMKEGEDLSYLATDGVRKHRFGLLKGRWDGTANVLTGTNPILHPKTGYPFSVRERLRIQGVPDSFICYGIKYTDRGTWEHDRSMAVIKQTGKFMPIQFCNYFSSQVLAHINNLKFRKKTGARLITPNQYVDEAKVWYCTNVGYKHKKDVCAACWKPVGCPKSSTASSSPARRKLDTAPKRTKTVVKTPKKKTKTTKPRASTPGQYIPEVMNIREGRFPKDYHCPKGVYSSPFLGELIRADGTYYSRLERRGYYNNAVERSQLAKTPLHIARWAVQTFTKEGQWVLDPTMGAGTTAVEALRLGRNVAGVEIEYADVIRANVKHGNNPFGKKCKIKSGDARKIAGFLKKLGHKFHLVVNNPPYSGDTRQSKFTDQREDGTSDAHALFYDRSKKNLAFLGENEEYWDTIRSIYSGCIKHMVPGGHFVVGVKDMMRKKQPFLLHELLGNVLAEELSFVGSVIMKHYPGTLHLHTYEKRCGVKPPLYQTIIIFRKKGGKR